MPYSSFVNLFHVGLFFIASGYCFSEKHSETLANVKTFIVKRIKRLYVPFVLWNFGFLCLRNLFCSIGIYSSNEAVVGMYGVVNKLSLKASIRQAIDILLMRSGEQLAGACWFLRTLLILEIAFIVQDHVLKKISPKSFRRFRWVIAALMLAVGAGLSYMQISYPYNLPTICSVWCLFVLGIEWKKSVADNDHSFWKKPGVEWAVCVISLAILVVLNQKGSISYDSNQYPHVIFFLLAAFAGWALCWSVAGLIERFIPWLKTCFTYVGRRTLEVLFLHLLCFKLVFWLYIVVHGLELYRMAAFPVLTTGWWPLYWIVGVIGSLAIRFLYDWVNNKLDMKNKYLRMGFQGTLVVIFAAVFLLEVRPGQMQMTQSSELQIDESLDYSLVYNKAECLYYNPDVETALGDDEQVIFTHFLQYGMREGRMASSEFDVNYYRENNTDLLEAFGEDLMRYYLHYLEVFCQFEEEQRGTGISIADAAIAEIPVQDYTGRECLPEVEVTYEGKLLIPDVDYDVVYHNNMETGEATAIIVGLNSYSGIQKNSFTIE